MSSHIENLWAELDGVKRAIEILESCPQEERLRREVATLVTARGVYHDVEQVYRASMINLENPIPPVPEDPSARWYYDQSEVMLKKIFEA